MSSEILSGIPFIQNMEKNYIPFIDQAGSPLFGALVFNSFNISALSFSALGRSSVKSKKLAQKLFDANKDTSS